MWVSQYLTKRKLSSNCAQWAYLTTRRWSVAFASEGYRRASLAEDRRRVHGKLKGAAGAVIGIPVPASHQSCDELREFITIYSALLLQDTNCAAYAFWDESYTTKLAWDKLQNSTRYSERNNHAKKKRLVDAVRWFYFVLGIALYWH